MRDEAGLQRRQDDALGLDAPKPITTAKAAKFLSRVAIALRYGPTRGLPLRGRRRLPARGGVRPRAEA